MAAGRLFEAVLAKPAERLASMDPDPGAFTAGAAIHRVSLTGRTGYCTTHYLLAEIENMANIPTSHRNNKNCVN